MIAKKNPKADLEKKRFAFFQIGLILSGSLCLAAFEYSTAQPLDLQKSEIVVCDAFTIDDPVIDILIEAPATKYVAAPIYDEVLPTPDPIVDPLPIVDPIITPVIIVVDPTGGGTSTGTVAGDLLVEPIVNVPDIEPFFPGGAAEMAVFINKSIELPTYIPEYDQGTIYVSFVVNRDGSIEDVNVLRGLSNELNKAAVDVVKAMPKWTPGQSAGRTVRVRYTVPISIRLR